MKLSWLSLSLLLLAGCGTGRPESEALDPDDIDEIAEEMLQQDRAPAADPGLSPEEREAIEQALEEEMIPDTAPHQGGKR